VTSPRMLLKVMAFALGAFLATPVLAQTYTVNVTTSPNLGNIVPAATTNTTFSFASSSGTVSQSGTAVRRTSGTTRAQVSITCSGGGASGCAAAINVKIGSIGTPVGKAGSLGNFNVTATSGSITGSSGTNPLTFTITPVNKSTDAAFYIGADFPITASNSAGSVGAASSQMYVYVAKSPTTPTTGATVTASATTFRGIAFSGTPTMNFGVVSKPATGTSGTVVLGPSSDTVSTTGGISTTSSGTIARAAFNLTGESSMAITVTVDPTFTMNRSGGGSLTVTTNNSGLPTALSGTVTGSQGTASFYVGGSFPITSSTLVGTYSGSFNVTAAYN